MLEDSIISLVDPDKYAGGFPTTYAGELVRQPVLTSFNYNIGTDAPSTGAMLQNAGRGYNFLSKMWTPDSGTTISGAATVSTTPFTLPVADSVTLASTAIDQTLAYVSGAVDVQPDLPTIVSLGRTVSSVLRLRSSTTSTTTAALSGNMAAAAVADLRSCPTLLPTDITTSSMTTKDSLLNIPAYDGIASVQGCDVLHGVAPVAYSRVYGDGEYARGLPVPTGDIPSMLISPYITPSAAAGTIEIVGNTPAYSVPLSTTNMFRSNYRPFWLGSRLHIYISFPAVFANPASVRMTPLYSQMNWLGGAMLLRAGATTVSNPVAQNPGGLVECVANALDAELGWGFFGWMVNTVGEGNVITWGYSEDVPDLYNDASIGAVRVLKWNNVGADQTLSVEYRGVVEAVPQGATTKILRQDPNVGIGRFNMLSVLRMLYSSPSCPLSRVMTGRDWDAFTRGCVPFLNATDPNLIGLLKAENVLNNYANEAILPNANPTSMGALSDPVVHAVLGVSGPPHPTQRYDPAPRLSAAGMYANGMYAAGNRPSRKRIRADGLGDVVRTFGNPLAGALQQGGGPDMHGLVNLAANLAPLLDAAFHFV